MYVMGSGPYMKILSASVHAWCVQVQRLCIDRVNVHVPSVPELRSVQNLDRSMETLHHSKNTLLQPIIFLIRGQSTSQFF